jgi:exoribonuclease R
MPRLVGTPLDFGSIRTDLAVPGEFSEAALRDAAAAAASPFVPARDRTDLELVTVDPPGSKDLDQAVHISSDGSGYLISYAIADVASFVAARPALDAETNQRVETYYFPDTRVPLHPLVLSEGAASLLPGQPRPAALWQIRIDSDGAVVAVDVYRAQVKSRAQWDYPALQQVIGTAAAPAGLAALPEVGELLLRAARVRQAIALNTAEQIVEADQAVPGGWRLAFRAPLPVERWNAEISLLTGRCAAQLMIAAKVGILRTLPPPPDGVLSALRAIASELGVQWPTAKSAGEVLAELNLADPRHAAFAEHASSLLRGAAYQSFDGELPALLGHAGVGAPYAHVTAPLRRLVDRYGTEICLALRSGQSIPDWVRSAMPGVPARMAAGDRLAHAADRAVLDATEAFLLQGRIGEHFSAVVLDADEHKGAVVVDDPAVRATCEGDRLPVGARIDVTLTDADVATRTVRFRAVT